jgi:hypothetical protein
MGGFLRRAGEAVILRHALDAALPAASAVFFNPPN